MENVVGKLDALEKKVYQLNDKIEEDFELKSTVRWCVTTLRRMMDTKDLTARIISDLKTDYEIDYQLHIKHNISTWTIEFSSPCARIRSILSTASRSDKPTLASTKVEADLLEQLHAIDAGSDSEASKAGRAGYFKLLHRAIDGMTTLSADYVADVADQTEHRRRAAQYLCTELCAYWNSGLPCIYSCQTGQAIPLISSEEVFRDMWRALREKKYKKAVRSNGTPSSSQSAPTSAGKLRHKAHSDSISLGGVSASSSPRSAAGSATTSALKSRRVIQEAKREIAQMDAFRLLADDIDGDLLSMVGNLDDCDDDSTKRTSSSRKGPELMEPVPSPSVPSMGHGDIVLRSETGSHQRLKPIRKKSRSAQTPEERLTPRGTVDSDRTTPSQRSQRQRRT